MWLQMPGGINGLDLAAQLRERKPGFHVVISCGYSRDLAGVTPPRGPRDRVSAQTRFGIRAVSGGAGVPGSAC